MACDFYMSGVLFLFSLIVCAHVNLVRCARVCMCVCVCVCVCVCIQRDVLNKVSLFNASCCSPLCFLCYQVLALQGRKKTYYYALAVPTAAPSIALAVG